MTNEILKFIYEAKGSDLHIKAQQLINSVGYKTLEQQQIINSFNNDKESIECLINYLNKIDSTEKINKLLLSVFFTMATKKTLTQEDFNDTIKKINL